MEERVIIPNVSIGNIILNQPEDEFDIYDELVTVEYDDKMNIKFIEVNREVANYYKVQLFDIDVFESTVEEIINRLKQITHIKWDGMGFSYFLPEFNLGFWRDDNSNVKFETISLRSDGYNSRLNEAIYDLEDNKNVEKKSIIKGKVSLENNIGDKDINRMMKKYGLK